MPAIRLGLSSADAALKQNPQMANVYAMRGELLLLRARSLSGGDRHKIALEAQASFDQAFQIKKALKREYGEAMKEAVLLSTE